MTIVFFIGEKTSDSLKNLALTQLTDSYNITYMCENEVIQRGRGYEILISDRVSLPRVMELGEHGECVIVMKETGIAPASSLTLPEKTMFIANSGNTDQLIRLSAAGTPVITCGSGKKDTISYSGYNTKSGSMSVSLNRVITAFSGKKIQPLEFPVTVSEDISVYNYLAFAALRLVLDDFNSDIGKLL